MTRKISRGVSRRTMLRGAGVALGLPWLESLAPREARAQATGIKRLIVIFFPNGTNQDMWIPAQVGSGAGWTLSPILEPFTPFKDRVTVISNMENYSPWKAEYNDTGASHGRRPGCFLTAANVFELQNQNGGQDVNGISFDQVIAQNAAYSTLTPLSSLQLSCGTSDNACDGPPCSYSRGISWLPNQPLVPEVDPGAAFDRIAGSANVAPPTGGDPTAVDPAVEQRRALNQSIIDGVLENANTVNGLLSAGDKIRMDEFLTSVRGAEGRIAAVSNAMQGGVSNIGDYTRPTLQAQFNLQNTDGGYQKGAHMDVMNDLIMMALETDTTRIITHMVEHERSEFNYDHVPRRTYTTTGSQETTGMCGNYHGSQHGNQDEFATITQWNAQKVADLALRMDAIADGPGTTMLDNSLIMFASCMDGNPHFGNRIPVALIGGAGGAFTTDQHISYQPTPNDRAMRDLYLTIMNGYFGLNEVDFGNNEKGTPISILTELLA